MNRIAEVAKLLNLYLIKNSNFKARLANCTCPLHATDIALETHLNKRPEELCALTVCAPTLQTPLKYKNKIPKLHHPNCIHSCSLCGINRLFPTISCPIWNSCSDEVSVIVWEDAARSGGKTQLEQVEKQMKVSEAFEKLQDLIKDGRSGFVRGEWSNWQRKLDVKESNKNTRVILTDFSASLDLRARITDNCSVDNHAVLNIFFCLSNFQQVQL